MLPLWHLISNAETPESSPLLRLMPCMTAQHAAEARNLLQAEYGVMVTEAEFTPLSGSCWLQPLRTLPAAAAPAGAPSAAAPALSGQLQQHTAHLTRSCPPARARLYHCQATSWRRALQRLLLHCLTACSSSTLHATGITSYKHNACPAILGLLLCRGP